MIRSGSADFFHDHDTNANAMRNAGKKIRESSVFIVERVYRIEIYRLIPYELKLKIVLHETELVTVNGHADRRLRQL
jgi:hypothetical protein